MSDIDGSNMSDTDSNNISDADGSKISDMFVVINYSVAAILTQGFNTSCFFAKSGLGHI